MATLKNGGDALRCDVKRSDAILNERGAKVTACAMHGEGSGICCTQYVSVDLHGLFISDLECRTCANRQWQPISPGQSKQKISLVPEAAPH